MKTFFLILTLFITHNLWGQVNVNLDSLKKIAVHVINEAPIDNALTVDDYGVSFGIQDIISKEQLKNPVPVGIYTFGRFGDDVDSWILLYERTTYEVLRGRFDYKTLGKLLAFFERNNYHDDMSVKYLRAVYEHEKFENSWGVEILNTN